MTDREELSCGHTHTPPHPDATGRPLVCLVLQLYSHRQARDRLYVDLLELHQHLIGFGQCLLLVFSNYFEEPLGGYFYGVGFHRIVILLRWSITCLIGVALTGMKRLFSAT